MDTVDRLINYLGLKYLPVNPVEMLIDRFVQELHLPGNTQPDPPENCHLTVKKLPKTFFSEKKSSFWQFFDSQMATFRRVSPQDYFYSRDDMMNVKQAYVTPLVSALWTYTI